MPALIEPQALICLAALTGLEIVLGVDNVVFITILVGKLPPFQRPRGRRVALTIAMIIMVVSIAVSTGVMMLFAGAIGGFVERHPTMKMLALSFLVLIGVVLVAGGMGQHIPNGYIYFAMAFSIGVEMLNINARKRAEPVHLHQTYVDEPAVEV